MARREGGKEGAVVAATVSAARATLERERRLFLCDF
jgi:hypothetical protein